MLCQSQYILWIFLPQDHSSGRVSCPYLLHELVELLSVLSHLVNDDERVSCNPAWCIEVNFSPCERSPRRCESQPLWAVLLSSTRPPCHCSWKNGPGIRQLSSQNQNFESLRPGRVSGPWTPGRGRLLKLCWRESPEWSSASAWSTPSPLKNKNKSFQIYTLYIRKYSFLVENFVLQIVSCFNFAPTLSSVA